MGYVDLHCHLLPGVDDGSPSMEASLKLAAEAVHNGVSHALVTPHHLNREYVNHKAAIVQATQEFQTALNERGINLTVFPGQEVHLSDQILPALDNDDLLFADESNRYLLLELPSGEVPTYALQLVDQLRNRQIIPVIVHPERNQGMIKHPEKLAEFLEHGCLSQITASSYLGTFGKTVQKTAEMFVKAGQGTVLASDAHVLAKRDYELAQAYRKLAKQMGKKVATQYQQNAKDIINGDDVWMQWQPVKKKLFGLF